MENSNSSLDAITTTQDAQKSSKDSGDLAAQVRVLKDEVNCLKKKLKKTEYEKDNAEGHVKNLKRDLDLVRKEFYEEKQKWKKEKEALSEACQRKEQQCAITHEASSKTDDNDGEETDIKKVLEEAASQAIAKSGLVYDENSGLYFDWSCGLYYDPNSCLYYNNLTGTYYYFNEETNSYEFHSQVELPAESTEDQYKKRKKKKDEKKNKKTKKKLKEKLSSDENESSSGELVSSDDDSNDDSDDEDEVHHTVAPCIRAIVTKSDKIKLGTLFIVTCIGGTLGREKDVGHTIVIPDVAVSKFHCKFSYDEQRRQYFLFDLGSKNGTTLNNQQFGKVDQESDPQVLTHGDRLSIGGTTLAIHIHQANETCDGCEPGLVQSFYSTDLYQVSSNGSSEDQRKKHLKNMKKAYGLAQEEYTEGSDILDKQKYRDRADLRRANVGSDVPNQPDAAPSSVHRPISTDNKGRKMLEKMGWKDGEGLGKESTGLKEPVMATIHEQSRGIGYGIMRSIDATTGAATNALSKTRERYNQIFQTNATETKKTTTTSFVPQVNK